MVMGNQYNQLGIEEREKIALLKAARKSVREIARCVGRHHTTISRELRRNACPVHPTDYKPFRAELSRRQRKSRASRKERLRNPVIKEYIRKKLKKGWLPEQISGRIPIEHPGLSVSHEAIYQYAYAAAPTLIKYLARHHRRRRAKRDGYSRRVNIPHRINISLRPKEINDRQVFGHWEADSLVSQLSQAACHVLLERKSRLVKITKLERNTSFCVSSAIERRLGLEPKQARVSITYDNGFENKDHEKVNGALGIDSYFCNPYHSWEKGSVENTNGLIRRFIPKKTDFSRVASTKIRRIENLLNTRPRKCLQYKTPRETYQALSGALAG